MTHPHLADVGVIGLAVMGSNLARNLARHGHTVTVFNRTHARTLAHLEAHAADGRFVGAGTVAHFVASLERPRRIIIMVKAASHRRDRPAPRAGRHRRRRRQRPVRGHPAALRLRCATSGCTSWAPASAVARWVRSPAPRSCPAGRRSRMPRWGRSWSPSPPASTGSRAAHVMGPDGAGHFVKMVHDGIEYADMQFIAEAYDVLSASPCPQPPSAPG